MRRLVALARSLDERDLAWVVDIVWPWRGGDAVGPSDRLRASNHRAFPSPRRPLVVLPGLTRRATIRALAFRPRLQSRSNRLLRYSAAAWVLLSPSRPHGKGQHLGSDLLASLSERFGRLVWVVTLLGRRDPNRKPVLQLVDELGRTLGFAKVGWNPPTQRLVQNEVDALRRLGSARAVPGVPLAPELLWSDELYGVHVAVTGPLPVGARAWANHRPPPRAAMLAVAAACSATGRIEHPHAGQLQLWSDHERRLRAIAGGDPRVTSDADSLTGWLAGARARVPPNVTLPEGGWHGDWAPWNLAVVSGRVVAWDWEHSGAGKPVGFDAIHYLLAVSLHVDRVAIPEAVARLYGQATLHLPPLGVAPVTVTVLVSAYLVERWLRITELAGNEAPLDPDDERPALVQLLLAQRPPSNGLPS